MSYSYQTTLKVLSFGLILSLGACGSDPSSTPSNAQPVVVQSPTTWNQTPSNFQSCNSTATCLSLYFNSSNVVLPSNINVLGVNIAAGTYTWDSMVSQVLSVASSSCSSCMYSNSGLSGALSINIGGFSAFASNQQSVSQTWRSMYVTVGSQQLPFGLIFDAVLRYQYTFNYQYYQSYGYSNYMSSGYYYAPQYYSSGNSFGLGVVSGGGGTSIGLSGSFHF